MAHNKPTKSETWPLFWKFYTLVSPILSLIELEYPLFFLTGLCSNLDTYDKQQLRVIVGTAFPLLSYYFYSIFFTKRMQINHQPQFDDAPRAPSLEYLQSLARKIEEHERKPSASTTLGLSSHQVQQQRMRYGFNETWTEPTWVDWLVLIWKQITRAHILLLEAFTFLSIYMNYYIYSVGFITLGTVNLGYILWQHQQKEKVLRSLTCDRKTSSDTFRDGQFTKIPVRELVPGDLIHLKDGGIVGADAHIVYASSQISMDESAVIGETTAIPKSQGDMCYYSTDCIRGDGYLLVNGTGYNTFVGRTVSVVGQPTSDRRSSTRSSNRAFEDFKRVVRNIGTVSLVIGFLIFIIATMITRHLPDYVDWLRFGFSLMICMLPVYVHSVLGMLRINALPQLTDIGIILSSNILGDSGPDILAGIDVLVSVKTGTLTRNDLRLEEPIHIRCGTEELLLCAALSIPGKESYLDPIDKCVLNALNDNKEARSRWDDWDITDYSPFDPQTKTTRSVVKNSEGETMTCLKGAPKAVLEMCRVSGEDADKFQQDCANFAGRGIRTMAVARKREKEESWQLLGLLPMFDPPRDDTVAAVKEARALGVDVRMTTGDAVTIAKETGPLVGINGECIHSGILKEEDSLTSFETRAVIDRVSIYSEIFPEQKKRLVEILQKAGHHVAITGDAVEETPALRAADFGIAVEGSTERAQSAADGILTNPGLMTIVQGLQVSRQIAAKLWVVLTCSAVLVLQDLCLQFFVLLISGEALSPTETMMLFTSGHIICIALSKFANPAPLKKPVWWTVSRLWQQVLPIALLFVFGSLLAVGSIQWFTAPEVAPGDSEMCSIDQMTAAGPKRSSESFLLLFFYVLFSRRWLFTILSVDWSIHSPFGVTVLSQLAVDLMVVFILNPLATLCISLINLYVFMAVYAIRQAQEDEDDEEKTVDHNKKRQ